MSAEVNLAKRVHLWGNALLARSAAVTEADSSIRFLAPNDFPVPPASKKRPPIP
jgi:hypothetical protein